MIDKEEGDLDLPREMRRDFFKTELKQVKSVDAKIIPSLVEAIQMNKQILPRKPKFDTDMTAEAYNAIEVESFKEWRQNLE